MAIETVQRKCCNQCLFTPNKIVSDERKTEILKSCKKHNNHFVCHKATIRGCKVTCRGFYDKCTNPEISALFEKIGQVEFVDIN